MPTTDPRQIPLYWNIDITIKSQALQLIYKTLQLDYNMLVLHTKRHWCGTARNSLALSAHY